MAASRDLFLGRAAFLLALSLGIQSYKHSGVRMWAGVSGLFLSASPTSCSCVWLQLLGPARSPPWSGTYPCSWEKARTGARCPVLRLSLHHFTDIWCLQLRSGQVLLGFQLLSVLCLGVHILCLTVSRLSLVGKKKKKERLDISYQLFCLSPFSLSLEIYTFFFFFQWGFWREWR